MGGGEFYRDVIQDGLAAQRSKQTDEVKKNRKHLSTIRRLWHMDCQVNYTMLWCMDGKVKALATVALPPPRLQGNARLARCSADAQLARDRENWSEKLVWRCYCDTAWACPQNPFVLLRPGLLTMMLDGSAPTPSPHRRHATSTIASKLLGTTASSTCEH